MTLLTYHKVKNSKVQDKHFNHILNTCGSEINYHNDYIIIIIAIKRFLITWYMLFF